MSHRLFFSTTVSFSFSLIHTESKNVVNEDNRNQADVTCQTFFDGFRSYAGRGGCMWMHVCIYVPLFWQVGSWAIWIDQQRSRRNTAIAAMECHSSKSPPPPHRGKDTRIGLSMPRVTPPLHLSITHGGTIAVCHLKKQSFPIRFPVSYHTTDTSAISELELEFSVCKSTRDMIWWKNRTRKAIGCYFIIEHNGSPRLYARVMMDDGL